ncbi:MAG: hypothetical protein K2M86_02735, partial [Odoribacter sp.]|nr:hypothetical protein [Odoribacter sp.]
NTTAREANVTVRAHSKELSATLTIRQEGIPETPEGVFPKTEFKVACESGFSISIEFTVPVAWEASIFYTGQFYNWLSFSALSGTAGKTKISITTTGENIWSPTKERKAFIDITYGTRKQRINITQCIEGDITPYFDPKFAQVLQNKRYIQDATHITDKEVEQITSLDLHSSQLTSLQGIEYFTKLTELRCNFNSLTTLDVSKNTQLTELICQYNQLTTLDVSKNTRLVKLWCDVNQLTTLGVSKNTRLTELGCDNNQLMILDVSKNTQLTKLNCGGNQFKTLDVSQNTALTSLWCASNQLTTLDVSKNTRLVGLQCSNNQLTTLNVSENTALTELYCDDNPGKGSIFPLTTWVKEAKPTNLRISTTSWSYNGETITIQYQ